jgi:hypothetical protein
MGKYGTRQLPDLSEKMNAGGLNSPAPYHNEDAYCLLTASHRLSQTVSISVDGFHVVRLL